MAKNKYLPKVYWGILLAYALVSIAFELIILNLTHNPVLWGIAAFFILSMYLPFRWLMVYLIEKENWKVESKETFLKILKDNKEGLGQKKC